MRKHLLLASVVLALAGRLTAAPIAIDAVNGGAASGSPKLNLDGLAFGNAPQAVDGQLSLSFNGSAGVVQGAVSGQYAAPFISGSNGDGFGNLPGANTTKYLSTGDGSIVFSFATPKNYFGLLWGSVDNYNNLDFYFEGSLIQSFNGVDVWNSANGDQGVQGTYYVNFNASGLFDQIVARSGAYAFEIDNIAYSGPASVPDHGTTLLLVGAGLAGMAALRRRR